MKVKIKKRWTVSGSCGGYIWYASGTCNRKKFKARKRWYGNLTSRWTVEDKNYDRDPRFSKTELSMIGREINKPERIARKKRRERMYA